MPTYIFNENNELVDKHTGEPIPPMKNTPPEGGFFISGDYKGYQCPVTNKWIEGRRAHEENLKRTGCRVLEKGEREGWHKDKQREDAQLSRRIEETVARTASQLGVE